jgi:hypothetical protein
VTSVGRGFSVAAAGLGAGGTSSARMKVGRASREAASKVAGRDLEKRIKGSPERGLSEEPV